MHIKNNTIPIKKLVAYFLGWKILIYFFAFFAAALIPLRTSFTAITDTLHGLPYLVWIWGNFDGIHYMEIARNRYHPQEHAFFPFYPLIMRFVFYQFSLYKLYIPILVVGQLVSNAAFLGSLFLIFKTLVLDKIHYLFYTLLVVILLFPTSYSYGAVYNDSLFLLLATATIYLARKKSFFLASLCGAFATLTRLNGLALFFLIAMEAILSEKANRDWRIRELLSSIQKSLTIKKVLKTKLYSLLLLPGSFLGYLLYTHIFHGNWNLVFQDMKNWNQSNITFPLQVAWRYFKIIVFHPKLELNYWVAIIEVVIVCLYVFILLYTIKKIRLSYWIFFALSILIPALTGTFAGMPRYGLHLYPFFLGLSLFFYNSNTLIRIIYIIISVSLLFFCLGLFTRGYFIA